MECLDKGGVLNKGQAGCRSCINELVQGKFREDKTTYIRKCMLDVMVCV